MARVEGAQIASRRVISHHAPYFRCSAHFPFTKTLGSGDIVALKRGLMATSGQAAAVGDIVARAHARLLADNSLQFHFTPLAVPKPPSWLPALIRALEAMGPALRVLFWIAVGGLLLIWAVRAAISYRRRYKPYRLGGPSLGAEPPSLQPGARRARALLEEADRLAAEHRFEEAVHVLLFRTIADLESRRPRAVRPALTSRDIAALDEIPPPARGAFAAIAELVERSFFGGGRVGAQEFSACRGAYLRFVDPRSWTVNSTLGALS